MWQPLLEQLRNGNVKALARAISFVENEQEGYQQLLQHLPFSPAKIIGITGPPGAGKSTLTDGLIKEMVDEGRRVAVLCVDPSSPFHLGALLGDRIRMSHWYAHPQVYIRSLASRGAVGGLHPKIIEATDLVKAAGYDYVVVETVGVGQSEIEIAGLADVTVVVVVPEAGDEIQTMKAGLMEIADIFVVNKSDRPGADAFVKNLRLMLAPAFAHRSHQIPVLKTAATTGEGLAELYKHIKQLLPIIAASERKGWLLTEKVYGLLQKQRMKDVDKQKLKEQIGQHMLGNAFNAYTFVQLWEGGAHG
ncbi:MAG TPA: methylmalonyl Co-A mutase-associated GTPase MeaB [Flavisolibacter sp.]|nr:methylmalonyl Co-A mutase-associated GTPase MeaB [Flavisolibacter sp.]